MDRMNHIAKNRCMSEEATDHPYSLSRDGQGKGGHQKKGGMVECQQQCANPEAGAERRLQTGPLFPRAPSAADGFHGHWE